MRRLLAILLFAAVLLPFAAPAFALGQDADAGLLACCRRNGAHHCAMSMGERTPLSNSQATAKAAPHWHAPMQCCPYCPASVTAMHADSSVPTATRAAFAASFSHPSGLVQTESLRRIARDRSRQKRGPPAVSPA